MTNRGNLDRFLAISWLYLLMTEKTSDELSIDEVEDLFVALNGDVQRVDETGAALV